MTYVLMELFLLPHIPQLNKSMQSIYEEQTNLYAHNCITQGNYGSSWREYIGIR
jgi:hypothetical protein